MSSKTRKRPYSQDMWRSKNRADGSVATMTPSVHGYQTNPSTGKPSPGPSGAIRRADEERTRVFERAQRSIKKQGK